MISLKNVRLWHQLCATLLITFFVSGCINIIRDDHPQYTYLVSSSKVADIPVQSLSAIVSQTNPTYAALLKYSVGAYKLVYKTKNWDGTTVQASGLVLIPDSPTAVPMISQQHGTIFDDADAPSNFGPNSEAYQYSTIFSSNGYIIACPDYIGFGVSKNLIHTYEHKNSLAQTSLDMLRAARELLQVNAPNKWDSRLYLAGYSEGGYATMSLYKKMQEEVPTEFNLKAVSAGAGAYDKTNFTKAVIAAPVLPTTVEWNRAFLWVLLTYNDIYPTLRRPLSYYFKPEYLTDVQTNRQLASISGPLSNALTDQFKIGVLTGADAAFTAALADNDNYDWKPRIPLLLTHGDQDPQVYVLNTYSALQAMIVKNGANLNAPIVIPNIKPGLTHVQTIPSWLNDTFALFTTVK